MRSSCAPVGPPGRVRHPGRPPRRGPAGRGGGGCGAGAATRCAAAWTSSRPGSSWSSGSSWPWEVLAGVVAAHATDDSLSRLRTERHQVTGQLTKDAPWSAATAGQDGDQVRAEVRWKDAGGAVHTGHTFVDAGHHAGYHVRIWTDQHGKLADAPPGDLEVALQSALLGGSAAVAFGGITYLAGRGVRAVIDSRRAVHWDKEWEAGEPWWGHRMG